MVEERARVAVLNLSRNRIGDAGFLALAQAFESPKIFLQRVVLGNNLGVGLAGTTALGRSLRTARIHAMSLTKCYIGNK